MNIIYSACVFLIILLYGDFSTVCSLAYSFIISKAKKFIFNFFKWNRKKNAVKFQRSMNFEFLMLSCLLSVITKRQKICFSAIFVHRFSFENGTHTKTSIDFVCPMGQFEWIHHTMRIIYTMLNTSLCNNFSIKIFNSNDT